MKAPIALVMREPISGWQQAIASLLPEERIVPFADLQEDEKAAVEIAVVANPDPAEVAELPNLTWIHSLWAGVERLVAELGPKAPPIVRLVDPELGRTMAEAVLAWTYYIHRGMPTYRMQQQSAVWQPLPYVKPQDFTVGILGLGALGVKAAERLQEADFVVKGWSRSPKTCPGVETFAGNDGLEALLAASDVVICLVPLTSETRGLVDARRLAQFKPGASIINFARGPVIVEADLVEALDTGRLSHAVLDVFDTEPLPEQSPFWAHPKVTVLPHISGPTDRATAAANVAGNIRAYRASGKMPATVDPVLGY